jgi:hypothetical protein
MPSLFDGRVPRRQDATGRATRTTLWPSAIALPSYETLYSVSTKGLRIAMPRGCFAHNSQNAVRARCTKRRGNGGDGIYTKKSFGRLQTKDASHPCVGSIPPYGMHLELNRI